MKAIITGHAIGLHPTTPTSTQPHAAHTYTSPEYNISYIVAFQSNQYSKNRHLKISRINYKVCVWPWLSRPEEDHKDCLIIYH